MTSNELHVRPIFNVARRLLVRSTLFQVASVPVAPQPDADLDVRTLRSWLAVDDDGDPVLVVKDDDTTVVIDVGAGDSWACAIRAAEHLSDMALAYASQLRSCMALQAARPEKDGGQS
ncbi:hypothetical protein AB0J72_25335 [Dactylosporangium sp. NPDC049742]|uniref:hypothetical protein n=1 Tax=Dactylosporangium sp. NPDC049742 TaxID=3154737 RepID=UPI0034453583